MEKKPKLNLDPPDLSKAKLNLGEESASVKIDPKLKLNSEPIGLAQKLVLDLEKAYDNPMIKAYLQAEKDRNALIQASIDKWNEPSLQNTFKEYEKIINSPAFSMALEKPTSVQDYVAQIANSFASKNYEDAKKTLEGFHPQMNSAYSVAQSALEQMQKTIDSPSIQSYLSKLPNLEMYESGLAKAVASIAQNENLLSSAKTITSLGKSLASDSVKKKMEDHAKSTAHIIPKEYPRFELPKTSIIEQNNQLIEVLEITKEQNDSLIEQNSQLIELTKSQSSTLIDISEQMRIQNDYTDIEIQALEGQNTILADQVKDNRKSSRATMIVAIISILISAVASYMSYKASYDIYEKERAEDNNDSKQLLKAIDDKTIENQKQDQLIKLIEEQNGYLKKLAQRESK